MGLPLHVVITNIFKENVVNGSAIASYVPIFLVLGISVTGKVEKKGNRGILSIKVCTKKQSIKGPKSKSSCLSSNRLTVSRSEYADFKAFCQMIVQFLVTEESTAAAADKQEVEAMEEIYGVSLGLTKESQKLIAWTVYADEFVAHR